MGWARRGSSTSVSAVLCWRAPAPKIAVLRLQDELRQLLVQEEEADGAEGDAPPRRLQEVGDGGWRCRTRWLEQRAWCARIVGGVEGGGGGELEPAMGPSTRRRGVRGLMCVG